MPRISERQNLLGQIGKLLKTMAMFGDDETDDFEELLDLKAQLESVRFLNLKEHVIKNPFLRSWGKPVPISLE